MGGFPQGLSVDNCPNSNSISDLWPIVFQPFSDLSLGWLLRSCLIFGPFQPRLLIAELLIKKKSVLEVWGLASYNSSIFQVATG